MPLVPVQNQVNMRPSEINKINPAYSNLSIEEKFLPVKGVTYIWLFSSKEELIIGIEEPWNHPDAFAVNLDNPEQKNLFEQMINQLRAPSEEQADTWKFGHPTLTATFNDAGKIEKEGQGLIGGEFSFNEEYNGWVVNNLSGRYGYFVPISEPRDREVEKKFQEQVIKTLYVVVNEFKKHHISSYLNPSFTEECYEPYILEKRDLLFQLKGSQRLYNALNTKDQSDPEFVKAFTHLNPDHIRFVNEDFFNLYKKDAIEILVKDVSVAALLELVERLQSNHNFSKLFGEYLEGIINSERFLVILDSFEVSKKLDFIIPIVDLGKLISRTASNLLSAIIRTAIRLNIDLNPYANNLLEKKSELLKRGFYTDLPKKLQRNLEIVREFTNSYPDFIQWVDRDFFILYPNEAIEILEKTNCHVICYLMNKFHSSPEFLNFAKTYLTAILNTTIFSEIIKHHGPSICKKNSELFAQILSWFGIKTIITKCEKPVSLFMVLKMAKEMNMDLTELTIKELTAKKLGHEPQIDELLNLLPESKCYEFAAEAIALELGHYDLKNWITSLNFEQMANLLTKKPSNLASILEIMDEKDIAPFIKFLVDLHLYRQYTKTEFKLDLLFNLYFDSNIKIKEKIGLTITPINAALIVLDDKKLALLLGEFGDAIIFGMGSALNFLSVLNVSLMEDKKKDLLIFSMLNRIVEITKNDYQFEKIFKALPKDTQKNNYVELMQAKRARLEQEKSQQVQPK